MKQYTLKTPVQHGQEQVTELTFIAPKAKHLRGMPAEPKMDDLLNLLGKLTLQPKSVIDELAMDDTMALVDIVGGFLQGGQPTGSNP